MAQTTFNVIQKTTDGHRLIQQVGQHAFTTTAGTVTMTVGFLKLVAAQISPIQVGAGTTTQKTGGYLPYVNYALFTQNVSRKFVVSRATGGGHSGLRFSYAFWGY